MHKRRLSDRLLDPDEGMLAALLLAPALLLLLVVVAYPVGRLLVDSLYDIRITRGVAPRFVGFDNFRFAWSDPLFWQSLRNTLIITVVTVPGSLLVGLGLALLANLPFRRKWPVRVALLMPWALPLAFVGMIFAWFFHSEYGLVNDLLTRVGAAPKLWFNSTNLTLFAICVATIWKTSSFMALILLAGLQTIPPSLYQAADVDGASRWDQFIHITLPLLLPSMLVALIFRTLTAIQSFDIPYNMAGPGEETRTLAMYVQSNAVDYLDIGYGSALAVMMFLLSMGTTFVYLKYVRAEKA